MTATIRQHEAGSTKRGIPPDYAGDNPDLCNARTKSGRPCRAVKLKGGRCKWHGGLSTGPRTAEGKAKAALNLHRRHLTESQRGMVAAKLANMPEGRPVNSANLQSSTSQSEAAKLLNVSTRTVAAGVKVRNEGTPATSMRARARESAGITVYRAVHAGASDFAQDYTCAPAATGAQPSRSHDAPARSR